jgi:Flp pilus assembly protein TadG
MVPARGRASIFRHAVHSGDRSVDATLTLSMAYGDRLGSETDARDPSQGGMKLLRVNREKGANLVEFALIAPFLILLLFGIIEFAWLFAQNLDVRHGAREGGRLAAVNYPVGPTDGSVARNGTDTAALVSEICGRMDIATGATVGLQSAGGVGDAVAVAVSAPGNTLTGLLDWALPPGLTLSSTIESRLEQPATWSNTAGGGDACP